jgi:site-specific recombinase XerD
MAIRGSLLSPEELAQNLDLSPATLATWRCQRKGPSFLRIGRKIWYPKVRVQAWLDSALQEVRGDGAASSERKMVLPLHAGRSQVRGEHKFARHQTKRERGAADGEHRTALLEGRRPKTRVVVREFNSAVREFLEWCKARYRAHPNSGRRIAVSLASALIFFGPEVVSMIDEGRIEAYKTWRMNEHGVRDITVRHDLHALSTFFQHAIKQHWTRDNPIRRVEIPSDADAVRMHVLTPQEEKQYFGLASKHRDLYDLGRLMLNQGMRPEEALDLRKLDVNLDRGQRQIRSGKSPAARRTLDLTPESREILARRTAGESSWIFPAPRKLGQHIGRLNNAHNTACGKTGLSFVLYDLRHTFATRMAEAR